MALAGLAGKALALIVQIVLGWLLVPDEFALYAIAISLTIGVAFLIDGGAAKILAQRPGEFERLVGPVAVFSIACNGLAAGLLAAATLIADRLFDVQGLTPLLLVLAASTLLRTPASILRARLQVQLRFRSIAAVEAAASACRSIATVLLAMSGQGAMSLALAALVATLAETIGLVAAGAHRGCRLRHSDSVSLLEIARTARWIMAATAAAAFAARGDYLVLGIMAPSVLGVYFFGFTLAQSALTLVTAGTQSVMLPTLSWIAGEADRFAAAASRAFRLMAFASAPLAAIGWLVLPAAIHVLWQGRWDASVPVAQSVAAALVFRAMVPLAYSLIESRGRWGLRAGLLTIDGVLASLAVGAAAALARGDLAMIAFALLLQQSIGALAITAIAAHASGLRVWSIIRWPMLWATLAAVSALAARWVAELLGDPLDPLPALAALATFGVLWAAIVVAIAPTERRELLHLLPGRR
jgi:PST family polysaccharide transporter